MMVKSVSFYGDPVTNIRREVAAKPRDAMFRALLADIGDTRPARGGWGEGAARAIGDIGAAWFEKREEEKTAERENAAKQTIAKALMGEQINASGSEQGMGGGVSMQGIERTPNTQADMARILAGNPDTAQMGFDLRMQEMVRQQQLADEQRAFQQRKELASMPRPGLSDEAFGQQLELTQARRAAKGPDLGKTPVYFRRKDGSVGIAQLSGTGGAQVVEGLPEGAQVIKPAERFGSALIDPLSTETRRDVTDELSRGKAAEKSGELTASELFSRREVAQGAARSLQANAEARKLLKEGVITGAGAGFITGFGKMLQQLGLAESDDAIANTEAFTAARAQEVAQIIKQFGAGTGLSDKDREFAEKAAAGQVSMTRESIKRILDLNDRASRNVIKLYNQDAKLFEETGKLPLTVGMPGGDEASASRVDDLVNKYRSR